MAAQLPSREWMTRFAEASAAYQAAGNFANSNAQAQSDDELKSRLLAIHGRAQLSQGDALLKAKKWADARRFFEGVAQSSSSAPTVVAGALCGLGEVDKKPDDVE